MSREKSAPRRAPAMRRLADALPAGLRAAEPPSRAAFERRLADHAAAGSNPCAGAPKGQPCFTWHNPDGTVTICTCDGNGNCQFPQD